MVKKYKCTRCGKMFIPVAYKYNNKLLALKKDITLLELCPNCEDILTALCEEELEYGINIGPRARIENCRYPL